MLIPIGFLVVLLSVFGGFVLSGGSLGPLFQPTELLMIGGAGLGAFIASNHGKALKATFRIFPRLRRSNRYDKAMYMELMALLYRLLSKARSEGMMSIERDVDAPEESTLFNEYPRVLADTMIMNFLTDYLRLMVSGNMEPMEIDELMLHEIEMFEQEAHMPADAISKVADGMPAFGIVAAVMGVVKALSSSSVDPAEMGVMIAHALVGTFLGILIGYGFISPLASRIERQIGESVKMLQCLRVTLLASLHGYPPQLAVEFGRKALHTAERPGFNELEDHVRSARSSTGTA